MQGMYLGPKAHGLESKYATIFVHCKTFGIRSISKACQHLSSYSYCIAENIGGEFIEENWQFFTRIAKL